MTEHSLEEVSLFDVADWLWSFRWLMLVCLAAAMAAAALAWQNIKAPEPTYDVKLQIFSGGTPVRTPAEIADILISGLGNARLVPISPQSVNPVIFRADDSETATQAAATAAALADAVLEEVRQQEVELRRLLQNSDAALAPYLSAKSFSEAARSGLIPLVVASIAPSPTSQGRALGVLLPFPVSGFAFFLIAGAISFRREWAKRRLAL